MPGRPIRPIPEWLIIDDADRVTCAKHNWFIDHEGYPRGPKNMRIHRFLLNARKGEEVDHVNGNRLDNRRGNLRFVTSHVNKHNRPASKNSKTGVKNVWFYPETSRRRARYMVQIRFRGTRLNLGSYKTLDDAAQVVAFWRAENMPGVDQRGTRKPIPGYTPVRMASQ